MINLLYNASDEAIAQQLDGDLRQAGYPVGEDAPERADLIIVLLSSAALGDQALLDGLYAALDRSQQILPVLTQVIKLPQVIDHLKAVDFSQGYDFSRLRLQLDALLSPDARVPMRVRTPTVKRANRSTGIILGIISLTMFAVGLYAVGVLHLQAPEAEFAAQYTRDAATRDVLIAPEMKYYGQFLPSGKEAPENYPATLRAVPTLYRLFIAQTSTAIIATPTPQPTTDNSGSGFGF